MQQPLGESPLVIIQTRCPVEIIRYMKGLAMLKYGKLICLLYTSPSPRDS